MRYHLNHMQNIQYLEKSIMIEEENARMFCDEPERWLGKLFWSPAGGRGAGVFEG